MPAERVGQADDHGEESRDVDGIDECILPDAGGEDVDGVLRAELVRPQRELFQDTTRPRRATPFRTDIG